MFHIYTIKNIVNNKIYVGKTNNSERRFKKHRYHATLNDGSAESKSCPKLYNSIRKYGIDKFEFQIIATCKNENDAYACENIVIEQYDSFKTGLNSTTGGRHSISGDDHPSRKLSVVQKNDIVAIYLTGTLSTYKIAEMYDVSAKTIGEVLRQAATDDPLVKISYEEAKRKVKKLWVKSISGENHYNNLFSDETKKFIALEYKTGSYLQKDLAKKYNCSTYTIKRIVKNYTY